MFKFSKHASLTLLGSYLLQSGGAMSSWATHRFNNTIMYYGLFGGGWLRSLVDSLLYNVVCGGGEVLLV